MTNNLLMSVWVVSSGERRIELCWYALSVFAFGRILTRITTSTTLSWNRKGNWRNNREDVRGRDARFCFAGHFAGLIV